MPVEYCPHDYPRGMGCASCYLADIARMLGADDRTVVFNETAERYVQEKIAELREENAKLKLIVRERTHRDKGCLCERCLEDEYHEATVIAELRRDAERLDFVERQIRELGYVKFSRDPVMPVSGYVMPLLREQIDNWIEDDAAIAARKTQE